MSESEYASRFAGIERLYGVENARRIKQFHICVIGIGGVGSWVAEAFARSGVGEITLIDNDDIALSNVNRQIHTLTSTLGQQKVDAMKQRIHDINPEVMCNIVDDFITERNYQEYLSHGYDYVVDAIDSIKFKALIISYCKRNKIPVVTTGGAGGLTDPCKIQVADLSKTHHDPLAAKVRQRLRQEHGFSKNPQRRFAVECVFSSQQQVYPKADGSVSHEKPGIHGVSLDCRFGYGASSLVTASFGLFAASRVIHKLLAKKPKEALSSQAAT